MSSDWLETLPASLRNWLEGRAMARTPLLALAMLYYFLRDRL
jgi:hypothetical protein